MLLSRHSLTRVGERILGQVVVCGDVGSAVTSGNRLFRGSRLWEWLTSTRRTNVHILTIRKNWFGRRTSDIYLHRLRRSLHAERAWVL